MKRLIFILALLIIGDIALAAEPCIKHKFQSAVTDAGDASMVGPSEWNECHSEPPATISFTVGCTAASCGVLADDDDYNSFWLNDTERTYTITKVTCKSDAGGPTMQLQRDDGSATNMFTTAITCDPTPTGTDGTDGILTSFISGENVISPAHYLNYLTATAGGVAKSVAITIKMTPPAP